MLIHNFTYMYVTNEIAQLFINQPYLMINIV